MTALGENQGFAPHPMMQSPPLPRLRGQGWKEGAPLTPLRESPRQAGDNCLLRLLNVQAEVYSRDKGKTPQKDPEGSQEVEPSNRVDLGDAQRTLGMGSHCHSVRWSQETQLVDESPGITSFETGRFRRLLTPFPNADETSHTPRL